MMPTANEALREVWNAMGLKEPPEGISLLARRVAERCAAAETRLAEFQARCGGENCMGWKLDGERNWVSTERLAEVQHSLQVTGEALDNMSDKLTEVERERDELRAEVQAALVREQEATHEAHVLRAEVEAQNTAIERLHRELAESDSKVEALRADRERLDWLERGETEYRSWMPESHRWIVWDRGDGREGEGLTLRSAIDAARAAEGEK